MVHLPIKPRATRNSMATMMSQAVLWVAGHNLVLRLDGIRAACSRCASLVHAGCKYALIHVQTLPDAWCTGVHFTMARMPAAALAVAVMAALLCGAAAQPASCPASCDLPQCPCYQA